MNFFDNVPLVNDIPLDIRISLVQIVVTLVIVLILWLLRHAIAGFIARPIRRLVNQTDTRVDDFVLKAIEGAISYFVLALGVVIGTLILTLDAGVRTFMLNIAVTLLMFGIFRALFSLTTAATATPDRFQSFTRINITRELIPVTRVASKGLVVLIGALTIAQIWNVSIAGIIAGIGLGGLALSLAAKEILDDVLGFTVIIGDDVFALDEYIISPHAEGIVERIGLRSTRVRQLDQGLTIVPNSTIANDSVTNWSRLDQRWFNFMIGLTYDSTAEQIESFVRQVREMLKAREKVQDDSVVVLFTEYDDSSLNVLTRCYVDLPGWVDAHAERHNVNLEIMRIVDDMDLSIAFPSRSLYLETVPAGIAQNGSSNGSRPAQHERIPARQHEGAADSDTQRGQARRGGDDTDISSVEDNDGNGDDGE